MKIVSLVQLSLLALLSGSFGWYMCHARKDFDVKTPYTISGEILEQYDNIVPVLIVGSGPAGLMAAVYAARAHIPTYVFEGSKPGGALMQTSYIENWPGYKKILGSEVIGLTKEQAQSFGAQFIQDSVEHIDASQWPFKVTTENGSVLHALSIIVTTGSSPKLLGIPGEQEYWGHGVTTCAICDAPFHKDKDVIVVGGGDSAVEEALQLAPYARSVTLFVRGGSLRAAASMQDHLKPLSNVTVLYNVELREIQGHNNEVARVVYKNTADNTTHTKDVSGVFLAIGHNPNSAILKDVVALDSQGYVMLDGRSQQTSLRAIFAAGDLADKHYKQASTAIGDGVRAALEAVKCLQDHDIQSALLKKLESRLFAPGKRTKFEVEDVQSLERLEDIIASAHGPVFVDCYAPYCPSCMMMLPAVSAVAQKMQDQATMVKVDVSKVPAIAKKYAVGSLPVMLVFNNGDARQEIARRAVAMTEKELQAFVAQYL